MASPVENFIGGFLKSLQDSAYQAGMEMLDENQSLKDAAQATLKDYRNVFPDASKDDIINHLGYFSTFLTDLVNISDGGFLLMDAEEAVTRIAATFASAGLLAYGIKEETNDTSAN